MFHLICLATAVICLGLFCVLLISPGLYVGLYAQPDAGAAFMGRRAAPIFLGLAVLMFVLRDTAPGALRDAVAFGMAATWAGIALTGIWSYGMGQASYAILVAAGIEFAMAAAFVIAR
ncbi:hypothetical protein SAMN05428995_103197 [Loktanella sp. DSM 29012]|uniref:hypothetical protein n=1 Tax=Loktanella sp. DSM 29012 TaxID=1881056 RepID=UPI0008AB2AD4|nr:hypothetical protein [Loktanella sp. DSM 29012]SEQ20122.1 hypothetical protein SAMN05428995_103197 [Loktanella sp. DSM 29012]